MIRTISYKSYRKEILNPRQEDSQRNSAINVLLRRKVLLARFEANMDNFDRALCELREKAEKTVERAFLRNPLL